MASTAGSGTGDFWRLTGNTATTPPTMVGTAVGANNYWGTTDKQNLAVGTNGTTRAIFDTSGNVMGGEGTYVVPGKTDNLVWGINDSVTSHYSAVFGQRNRANIWDLVSGVDNKVDGNRNVVGGQLNTLPTNAINNAVFGDSHTVSNSNNVVGGGSNTVYNAVSSIGSSAVFGFQNKDSAVYTMVSGQGNTLGSGAAGSGIGGFNNFSSGQRNLVWGNSDTATDNQSAIFGDHNRTSGGNTVIGGYNNTGWGDTHFSAIFGHSNADSARYNITVGLGNQVNPTSQSSATFGRENNNAAPYTIVAGYTNNLSATSNYSAVFGAGNKLTGVQADANLIGGYSNYLNTSAGANLVVASTDSITGNSSQNIMGGTLNRISDGANNIVVGYSDKAVNAQKAAVFGQQNIDSASYTLVSGQNNIVGATATHSVIGGGGNYTSGVASALFGSDNKDSSANTLVAGGGNALGKSADYSAVFGSGNKLMNSTQNDANVVGGYTNVLNTAAGANIVVGNTDTITGGNSSSNALFGNTNTITATGAFSGNVVGGFGNKLYNTQTAAVFGTSNKDSASFTLVAGQGNIANSNMNSAAVVGSYNTPVDNSLFLIGNGASAASRSNVMTALKNGNVGIGTTAPTTLLHVSSATSPAVRIADGSEGTGKILTSLDANGNAQWTDKSKLPRTLVTGTPGSTTGVVCAYQVITGTSITLPQGYWTIFVAGSVTGSGSLVSSTSVLPYFDALLVASSGSVSFLDGAIRSISFINLVGTGWGTTYQVNVTSATATLQLKGANCGSTGAANYVIGSFTALD